MPDYGLLGQDVIYHATEGPRAGKVVWDNGDGTVNLHVYQPVGLVTYHHGAILGAYEYIEGASEGETVGYWTVLPPPPPPTGP